MPRAAHLQTESHKTFIRGRWIPAWVDAVEYGKFGRATVTAILFGGVAPPSTPNSRRTARCW
ncbi:MAG: hypothetical protein ACAH88_13470 [Roseimicrobium sp.]